MSSGRQGVRSYGQETIFTDSFYRFASHYGFEAQACNPRKGNEKRHMENKVRYMRYGLFIPSPVIRDLAHLRELLFEKFKNDHQRLHRKRRRYCSLLKEERKYSLAFSETDYPVFKQSVVAANKYAEIRIDGTLIHLPKSDITTNYS